MTKKAKTIFWATLAMMMIIIGVGTYNWQRPKRPITHKALIAKTIPIVFGQAQSDPPPQPATSTPEQSATSTLGNKFRLIRKPKPNTIKPLSYGEAAAKDASVHIQFNDTCQAVPGRVVFANLTTIMLDNRSGSQQKIVVAGQAYIVAPYDYVLILLNEKTLPATLHVNCNNQKNAAEIIVE
jgi:hypothetical protein